MESVEAEQPGLFEDRACGERDDVALGGVAARYLLPIRIDALMHVGHELVEMRAALVRDRARPEEQVHQHGLATARSAMNIKPARRRVVLLAEQALEQAVLARGLIARQPILEGREGVR